MALLWRVLGGMLLLAWLSPSTATDQEGVQAPEMAAPAAVAPPAALESRLGNQTAEEDDSQGSRSGRFLSWPSPHPTMASFTQRASQLSDILRRAAKFLSAFASAQEDDAADNEIDVDSAERKEDAEDGTGADESPSAALSGLYTECLLKLSVPCVQRKLLLFLDRLGRMERFRLLGDFLTVVRVEPRNWEARRIILDEDADVTDLSAAADRLVDDFFDTHVIRFTLPGTLRVGRAPRTTVDIQLQPPGLGPAGEHLELQAEGRSVGKLSGGGGNSKKKQKMLKKIKKRLMKLLMMAMSVMMVMGPMSAGMAGNMAGLATFMGMGALMMMKGMIVRQMGGSMTAVFGNLMSGIQNLAGISPGGFSSYLPTGTGGGPYSRSDYIAPQNNYAYGARSMGDTLLGDFDPMALAYRAYAIASHVK